MAQSSDLANRLYASTPLLAGSSTIRVLKLAAASSKDADLCGDLCILDLSADLAPDYAALSYVWGEIEKAAKRSKILIGPRQIPFQLTDNCYNALVALRPSDGTFVIWVDAICINQINEVEKSLQLSLMGDIYSNANETFIWLGEEDEERRCKRAICCLKSVGLPECFFNTSQHFPGAQIKPRPFWAAWTLYWRQWSWYGRPDVTAFMASTDTIQDYVFPKDLLHLLDNQWLYRVWTYQEVMLSPNPILICGKLAIPWWRFSMSVIYLRSTEQSFDRNIGHGFAYDTVTCRLFKVLRLWRNLVMDRNRLLMSGDMITKVSKSTALDMTVYSKYISDIAEIFRTENTPLWGPTFLLIRIYFVLYGVFKALLMNKPAERDLESSWYRIDVRMLGYCSLSVLALLLMFWSWVQSLTFRRPRGQDSPRHKPDIWPADAAAQDTILSALWSRQCKEAQDMNFGTRNLVQKLTTNKLPTLNYSAPLSEIYTDLTIQVLRLTNSPELMLTALRSRVHNAPSWTVDWSKRAPLRLLRSPLERESELFYDTSKKKMPEDSWRHSPSQPGILQVRAWTIGSIKAILDFEKLETNEYENTFWQHIRNMTSLLQMARAQVGGDDLEYLEHNLLYSLGPRNFSFLQIHRNESAEQILAMLNPTGRGWETSSLGFDVEKYKTFCYKMAEARDRRIVILDGARPASSSIAGSCWPSNITLAMCHPIDAKSKDAQRAATNVPMTEYEECRVHPGDSVLQLCGMKEKAVVRQVEGKLIFIDAIEAMGSHIIVKNCANACSPNSMTFVDIS